MLTCRLQQIERSVRIHREVSDRLTHRPIVRRLRGAMYHNRNITTIFCERIPNSSFIANIGVHVLITSTGRPELVNLPSGARFLTKEPAAHVVVDSNDVQPALSEQSCCLA